MLVARPLVWLLETSTALLLKLLRIPEKRNDSVTEEEVKIAIAEGTEAGVIDEVEEEMIHGVLRLADNSVASIMIPRPDVYWIDLSDDKTVIDREIADCPYSRIVVARDGDLGKPLGVVQKKDLVADLIAGKGIQVEQRLIEPPFVPETMPVLRLLETFKSNPVHLAFVVDEYGDFLGVVTLNDVLEGIAGDLGDEHEQPSNEHHPAGRRLLAGGRARLGRRARREAEAPGYRRANSTPPPALRSTGSPISRSNARPSKFRAGGSKCWIWTASASTSCCSCRCRKPPMVKGRAAQPYCAAPQ